jgi:type II secretory pathway component GspD/PulD (secretin)
MRTCFLGLLVFVAGCCSNAVAPESVQQPRLAPVAEKPTPVAGRSVDRDAPGPAGATRTEAPSVLVSIDAQDDDLRDVLDTIGRQAGVNIVCEPTIHEKVTLRLRRIGWFEALQIVAEQTRCEINVLRGGVYYAIDPPRVSLSTY